MKAYFIRQTTTGQHLVHGLGTMNILKHVAVIWKMQPKRKISKKFQIIF